MLATTTRELIRGQTQDIAFETRADVTLDECLAMAAGKTGSLLAASAAIGGRAGRRAAADGRGAAHVRRGVGLAFQLVDDVLGIWGDPAVTGKPVHSDLRARKKSLPVTYAFGRGIADPAFADWLGGAGEADPSGVGRVADLLEAGRSARLGARRGPQPDGRSPSSRCARSTSIPSRGPSCSRSARFVVDRDS